MMAKENAVKQFYKAVSRQMEEEFQEKLAKKVKLTIEERKFLQVKRNQRPNYIRTLAERQFKKNSKEAATRSKIGADAFSKLLKPGLRKAVEAGNESKTGIELFDFQVGKWYPSLVEYRCSKCSKTLYFEVLTHIEDKNKLQSADEHIRTPDSHSEEVINPKNNLVSGYGICLGKFIPTKLWLLGSNNLETANCAKPGNITKCLHGCSPDGICRPGPQCDNW